jgi:hypothetical protein
MLGASSSSNRESGGPGDRSAPVVAVGDAVLGGAEAEAADASVMVSVLLERFERAGWFDTALPTGRRRASATARRAETG